jgi:hypothetical protein
MTNLYKKLAVAYAPENVKHVLGKIEDAKRAERQARVEAECLTRDLLRETGSEKDTFPEPPARFDGPVDVVPHAPVQFDRPLAKIFAENR